MRVYLALITLCSLFGITACQSETSSPDNAVNIATQQDINAIAKQLDVNIALVTNEPGEHCLTTISDGNCYTATLTLTALEAIKAKNWQIYFSNITPIQSSLSDEFKIEHINGDIHKLTLKPDYQGFRAGEAKSITFYGSYWSLSESDMMPNFIVTAVNLSPRVIESTKEKYDAATGLAYLPHVSSYQDKQKHFKRTAEDQTQWLNATSLFKRNQFVNRQPIDESIIAQAIIPTPTSMKVTANSAPVSLVNGIRVNFNNVPQKRVQAALDRLAVLGVVQSPKGVEVNLTLDDNNKISGSYNLDINQQAINISASTSSGVFYGLQSLAALLQLPEKTVVQAQIVDEPLFEFRGMLLDVARNFKSKEFVFKLLDQMAAYKLNKFHFHLADDEGWRIEIPGLPELTEISSKRCFDISEQYCLMPQLGAGLNPDTPVNGYYSIEEYKAILQYANARHIQIIPSLDMPGHSRAAVKAMNARYQAFLSKEQVEKAEAFLLYEDNDPTKYSSVQYYKDNTINVCLDSAYHFVDHLMLQMQKIHQQAGQALTRYHIGADETAGAWVDSPACKTYLSQHDNIENAEQLASHFVERVSQRLAKMGIEPAAWADGLAHTKTENMPNVVQANAWSVLAWQGHQQTHELANRNWQVVISSPDVLYFDFPYEADPKEHGYYWASREINTEKIFQFMPENLPAHAEIWRDRQNLAYQADDTLQLNEDGTIKHQPLKADTKFYGVQGQLWTENTRSDSLAEHKIFPRLLALAERGWHKANWALDYNYQGAKYDHNSQHFSKEMRTQRDKKWREFASVLGKKEFAKLEISGVNYRLPTVGAVINQGVLHANTAFPGLNIQYRVQGGQWLDYQKPVKITGDIDVRATSTNGKRFGRYWQVTENQKEQRVLAW